MGASAEAPAAATCRRCSAWHCWAAPIYVVQKEFRNLKIEDIAHALEAIPTRTLVDRRSCGTVLSYGILTFYDRLGTYLCRPAGQLRAGSRSPRSAPMRSPIISASPPCRAPRCVTGCMPIGG